MKIISQQQPSSGFADSTFHGLNTFYFISDSGARTAVRWSLVPIDTVAPQTSPGTMTRHSVTATRCTGGSKTSTSPPSTP